jgi:hypothetical protein
MANGTGVVLALGALLVWALGLYVISRSAARPVPILAFLAMVCLTAYLSGEALGALAPDVLTRSSWLRATWWSACLAAPTWLVLSLTLARDEDIHVPGSQPRWLYLALSGVAVAAGAIFGAVGSLTNLVVNWAPASSEPIAGSLLRPLQFFVLVCVVWALINLTWLWRASPRGTPLQFRFGFLTASAILFVLGSTWLAIGSGMYGWPGLQGQLLLLAGMAMMGWNLARYGALLAGEQVLSDFRAYAATMLAIVALYGGILVTTSLDYEWLERGLWLLLLIMATHVIVDTRGHLLDRLIYAPAVSTLRGQLRDLANRVVRQPDPLSALAVVRESMDEIVRERAAEASTDSGKPAEMRLLVEGALRRLNDMPALSEHPLLEHLPGEAEASPLERAAILRNEIDQAIERLRPSGSRPSPGTMNVGGWLHYLVLKEAYADGRPNKQVMQRYALSEGTFHRARRRAIDAVAEDLWQRTAQRAAASSPSTSSGATRSTV